MKFMQFLRRAWARFVELLHNVDRRSHGYLPMLCWLVLIFGGTWFPAARILRHVFNDEVAPRSLIFNNSQWSDSRLLARQRANAAALVTKAARGQDVPFGSGKPTATPSGPPHLTRLVSRPVETAPNTAGEADRTNTPAPSGPMADIHVVLLLPLCLIFWAWTNVGLLCVMASAMGEVNRSVEESVQPRYRAACTRAFFVYLFVLFNEIVVTGSLIGQDQLQESYTRIAVLASAMCFVASYRPQFFNGIVNQFGGNVGQGQAQPPQPDSTPGP